MQYRKTLVGIDGTGGTLSKKAGETYHEKERLRSNACLVHSAGSGAFQRVGGGLQRPDHAVLSGEASSGVRETGLEYGELG